jgi:hypothetical protein
MNDRSAVRERYLRDGLPVRLGGLAANLARIKSFAARGASSDAVESLIDESKFFIEWTAGDTESHVAEQLVALQVQLARWQCDWNRIWVDPVQRYNLSKESDSWSKRILDMSGLLDEAAK